MIVRSRKTGKLQNVKDVTIKHNGGFSDIVNHRTCEFFYNNTDPKVFFLDISKNGKTETRKYNITSAGNMHGLLADLRYTLIGEKGYMIESFRTYYKPKKLIEDEQQFLTNGLIQVPVSYKIIFNNNVTKPNGNEV
jgi:predicted DNA binding protein